MITWSKATMGDVTYQIRRLIGRFHLVVRVFTRDRTSGVIHTSWPGLDRALGSALFRLGYRTAILVRQWCVWRYTAVLHQALFCSSPRVNKRWVLVIFESRLSRKQPVKQSAHEYCLLRSAHTALVVCAHASHPSHPIIFTRHLRQTASEMDSEPLGWNPA